ncbi:MAG: septal ring lytic transglycosylase RlpA family protein [Gemmatimonadota bacterium]
MRLRACFVLLGAPLVWILTGCAAFGYPTQGSGGSGDGPIPISAPAGPTGRSTAGSTAGGYGTGPGQYYDVNGRRYYVMTSAHGYREAGLASWYGPGFHGRQTSSGERFDQDAMTAAHRTLPLGTVVRVRNLDTDDVATVRINDRGPFKDPQKRIIDLSYAAARELRIISEGTGRVEVVALTER